MQVDIKSLLRDQNIPHTLKGKNIGQGNIGIICPNCGDKRNHCSFLKDSGTYKCFSCDGKGWVSSFLTKTLGISYSEAISIIKQYSSSYFIPGHSKQQIPVLKVPGSVEIPKPHYLYLQQRGFDPDQLQREYDLRFEYQTGSYKYRVIVPIYFNNTIQTFIARDITGKQTLRYKNCPVSESLMPTGNLIFGWDKVQDTAIICEGVFDALKVGDMAVAVLGTSMTAAQIELLSTLKKAYILFDNDSKGKALKKAQHLLSILDMCGVSVKILTLPDGVKDPGELTAPQVHALKKNLF